jgi:hypothetical protein
MKQRADKSGPARFASRCGREGQADLFDRICASRLLSTEELRAAGALAMPESVPASGRKKKGKAPRKARAIRGKPRRTARAARKVRP